MKRIVIGLALVSSSIFLVGCGAESGHERDDETPGTHYSFYQDTPEGKVLCVWAKSGYGGGLSCDWVGMVR